MPSTGSASGTEGTVSILSMLQATVKSYDSITKTGMLVADDGSTETPFDGDSLGMFRFLRPGQRVTYDIVERDGERRILNLRIGIA